MNNEKALVVAGFPASRGWLAEVLGSLDRFAVIFTAQSLQDALEDAPQCSVVVMDYVLAEGGVGTEEVKELRKAMKDGAKLFICIDPKMKYHDKTVLRMAGASAVLSREANREEFLQALGDG